MSGSRESIFAALEAARPPAPAPHRPMIAPEWPEDWEQVLANRLAQNGGRLARAGAANWTAAIDGPVPLDEVEHIHVAESVSGATADSGFRLDSRGVGATARDVHEMASLEVCVLRGQFAVVENGAAWHEPASSLERAAALLTEHLVILVSADEIVASLHQAYDRIELDRVRFGWFLCGPSKTADIEQALVLGAHGPKTMQLILQVP